MKAKWIVLVSLFTVAACSSAENEGATGDEANVTSGQKKVSGFDFAGPKSLPSADVPCAFHVQPEEERACVEIGGVATQAAQCAILCSKPIAKRGTVAGYSFDGYQQLPSTDAPCAFHVQPEEARACVERGGVATQAAQCATLCSTPIARKGEVSGYDLKGFKHLPNDKVPVEFCTAQVSEVQSACAAVGGTTSPANGCSELCSLPL